MNRVLTPVKAIKAWCRECSGNQPKEVRLCPNKDCPLYPYRLGKNPNRSGIGSQNRLFCQKSSGQVNVSGVRAYKQ